jgi:hypothetical protein
MNLYSQSRQREQQGRPIRVGVSWRQKPVQGSRPQFSTRPPSTGQMFFAGSLRRELQFASGVISSGTSILVSKISSVFLTVDNKLLRGRDKS